MKVQICGVAVEVELTGLQKRMLAAGNSVTVNLYPDPDHREYTVKDMGFTSPRRVHVDSANHPNPAVDSQKFADQVRDSIRHERSAWRYREGATDLNYSFKGTDPELVKLYTGIDPELDPEFDPVDKPSHYAEGRKYEPIDVIEDWGLGMHLGNATKYISRAGRKGEEVEDLKKARWYIDRRISMLEKGEDKDD